MEKMSLRELAVPLIKSIDSFNYLLKSHHRRTAVISYYLGSKMVLDREQMIDLIVAASMHDIGAMSVQERDMLIKEDVENPTPHCVMGYKMLASFDVFKTIANILKHHHIKFNELDKYDESILIQSHIIHLADRVDISINPDSFILNQKAAVTESILEKCGTIFHPDVCQAFKEVAKADIFWIDINNMTMGQLFNKIDFVHDHELTMEQTRQFSLTISRIIDFRSKFTAAHSYSVGHLAHFLGRKLSLDEDTCNKLLIAGYFHDIGKIGIDTQFIEKTSKLTEEEFNQVKLHSYYTGQILNELSSSEWFQDIIRWGMHHHEKLNGSGYPYAIDSDSIDIGTNIIAYSDILSALMESRPYRESLGIDKSLEIIESQFHDSLDPKIFPVLKENKEPIEMIIMKCQKEAMEIYAQT